MAALHGGARPGSGRKPKNGKPEPSDTTRFAEPLAYLIAVANGETPGDALRVAAAKAALPYTEPRRRGGVESPHPRELARRAKKSASDDALAAWRAKADAIRAKHGDGSH